MVLVVGHTEFLVPVALLASHPDTMLGAMFAERNEALLGGRSRFEFDRDAAVFAAVLRYMATGTWVGAVEGVSERRLYEELDFWGVAPRAPDVPEDLLEEFRACIALVAEAVREVKPSYLARLKAGFLTTVRFVSPTFAPQPIEETKNVRDFLAALAVDTPVASADAALEAAQRSWHVWTASEAYARSVIRGVERLLPSALATGGAGIGTAGGGGSSSGSGSSGSSSSSSSSSSGCGGGSTTPLPSAPGTIHAAVAAAHSAALIYAASALITHGTVAQHLLRRELARDGLGVTFHVTVWPEDAAPAELEAGQVSNPYEDAPELGYGSSIVKLWAHKLRQYAEPAVWKVAISAADRARLADVGVKARKGVPYVLLDVRALTD